MSKPVMLSPLVVPPKRQDKRGQKRGCAAVERTEFVAQQALPAAVGFCGTEELVGTSQKDLIVWNE
jgi:hypothetical protein